MRAASSCLALTLGLAILPACASYVPPFAHSAAATAPGTRAQATVVFLWPTRPWPASDPGGYFTLATTDGRFIGNFALGSRLRVELAPGETTFVGWNVLQEDAFGEIGPGTVAVLRTTLTAGRTYYARLDFGDWDERGPAPPQRGCYRFRSRCVAPGQFLMSALVSVTPATPEWRELPEWLSHLRAIEPDGAAGQAWLSAHREVVEVHRAEAEARYAGLRPEARRLATLEADDGIETR